MLAAGTIVGHRYRIVDLVGTGGMAHVYRAINLSNKKTVAIKVLKEEFLNDAEFLRRFEREARAVLHLSHDNIVRAYGVGNVDDLPYIVLEFIEGSTLKKIITDNGPMPPRIAVALAVQVLDALSAAHSAGIIHRDIKPQNVIVTPNGKVKLMDFGIAREVNASTVTFTGTSVLGSVHYLSPEQAKGLPVTEASDLYSTGVMLYEMLTGRVPFDGDTSVSIALMHINDAPQPPLALNPKIPRSLNDVILRAMSKEIKDRYATAREMASHLKRSLKDPNGDFARPKGAGAPEESSGEQRDRKSSQTKRRKSTIIRRLGLIVFALVAIFVGMFLMMRDLYQNEAETLILVPSVTDRTIESAKERAEDFGFTFNIQEYEHSDNIPSGNVILQSPESGTRAKKGTIIQCIVSLGSVNPTVPVLTGLSPDEAKNALESVGLHLGSIEYRLSEIAIGYVCEQSMPAGAEATMGASIDVAISATSETTFDMPDAMDEPLNVTLENIKSASFKNLFVRYTPSDTFEDGVVFLQDPLPNTPVLPETHVTLTVSGAPNESFFADIAFNVTIPTAGSKVIAAVKESFSGVDYLRIVYETTLEKGEQIPVSFTAGSDYEGVREIVLFIDGRETKRQDYTFSPKGAS